MKVKDDLTKCESMAIIEVRWSTYILLGLYEC